MRKNLAVLFLALAFVATGAMVAGTAKASTFDLSLTGIVSGGVYSSSDWSGTHYDQWSLQLSGLSPDNAIAVSNGDQINVNVTLDQSFTIPASVSLTWFEVALSGDGSTDTTGGLQMF
jgi:TRAP-type uncharacterized transport system fused permease subunit